MVISKDTYYKNILHKYPNDKNKSNNHDYNRVSIEKFFVDYYKNIKEFNDFYTLYVLNKPFSEHWWKFVLSAYILNTKYRDEEDEKELKILTNIFDTFQKGEFIKDNKLVALLLICNNNYYYDNEIPLWFTKNIENGFTITGELMRELPRYKKITKILEITNISPKKKCEGWESKIFINKLFSYVRDGVNLTIFTNKYIQNKDSETKKFVQYTEDYLKNKLLKNKYLCPKLIFNLMDFSFDNDNVKSNLIFITYMYLYSINKLYNYYEETEVYNTSIYNKFLQKLEKQKIILDFNIIINSELKNCFMEKIQFFDFIIKKNIINFKPLSEEYILEILSSDNKKSCENLFSINGIKFLLKITELSTAFIEKLLMCPIEKLSLDLINIIKSNKKYLTENIFTKSIIMNNTHIVDYFINNKFIVNKNHQLLANSIEMLQVFKNNNIYLDFDSYRELVRTKKMSIDQLKSYSIYENDDDVFEKIKSKLELNELDKLISCDNTYNLIKLIEYLDVNKPQITLDMIIYQSTNSNRQILYEYYKNQSTHLVQSIQSVEKLIENNINEKVNNDYNQNTDCDKNDEKKVIKKVVRKVIKKVTVKSENE